MSAPLTDASIPLGHLETDNKYQKRNQMSIKTVSVEQTMGNTTKLKRKGKIIWGNGFVVR